MARVSLILRRASDLLAFRGVNQATEKLGYHFLTHSVKVLALMGLAKKQTTL